MGIFGKPSETKPEAPAPRPVAPAPPLAAPAPPARPCVLGAKTTVKGELHGEEDVVILGTVEGQIRVARELRVEGGGRIKGNLEAQTIVVAGEVTGDCSATARIEVQATGRITGDIRAPRIVIAEGAVFRGRSEMGGAPRKDKLAAS
jgi:cytoskeletal protein CcmA (bactofilin family)